MLTNQLNGIYREIAVWCTDRENHKYQSDYDQALILKRFVFEFFDCFFPLIYLGWWDLNFKVLRANVISVYTADEIRRVITETLIPYCSQSKKELNAGLALLKEEFNKKTSEEQPSKGKDQPALWD